MLNIKMTKAFFFLKKKVLFILEMLLTEAVSRGIHCFRLTVGGFMFRPQLNSELPLLSLN